ncbi:MAG: tRNA (adenosine(37)-N6)-threonylcarbamoyltransferase complex dimerization subunit type 1 TsaB, partial [Schleiferiaceae bacterium]|nr:tRNA (adenosine(37)-N6)-threonylcarbamoyltransferase complex dimerization subunit type 1 TsaB [Schleiferiaceae bacterium]
AKELIKHENAIFHTELNYPSVKQMKALSVKKFDDKAFEDVAYFEPYYLKDFVAGKPKKLL